MIPLRLKGSEDRGRDPAGPPDAAPGSLRVEECHETSLSENILPDLMRQEGIDLWLVMSNEPAWTDRKTKTQFENLAEVIRKLNPKKIGIETSPLRLNTLHSIEFSATTKVPEWDNQDVSIGFEDDAVFTAEGCRFVDGRQRALLLIR
jgi:hypothetical protein